MDHVVVEKEDPNGDRNLAKRLSQRRRDGFEILGIRRCGYKKEVAENESSGQ